MPSVVAFDSKDFYIPGNVQDFFCPIGIGLTVADANRFSEVYRKTIREIASKKRIKLKRSVFDSYTVSKLLGGEDSGRAFYDEVLAELKGHISYAHVFHTQIYPRKVQRILIYESTKTRALDPIEFLQENKAGYVVLCGWKYSETVPPEQRADMIYLDYFQAKRTHAWDALRLLHPHLYSRGDTCNPCVAMADGVLSLLDRQLKRNFYYDSEKLSDHSIVHALRDLGLKGESVFVGQPDFKKIIPYSSDQALTSDLIARPMHFLCSEKRPESLTSEQHREMLSLMPMMDRLVETACDANGCIKFYDSTEDYLKAKEGDVFAYYGDAGRQMHGVLCNHIKLAPLDLLAEKDGQASEINKEK